MNDAMGGSLQTKTRKVNIRYSSAQATMMVLRKLAFLKKKNLANWKWVSLVAVDGSNHDVDVYLAFVSLASVLCQLVIVFIIG